MSENELLFPVMENVVLCYLMDGEFSDMSDVSRNSVKDAILLNQRSRTIELCYSISAPTAAKRNKMYYNEFLQAFKPAE